MDERTQHRGKKKNTEKNKTHTRTPETEKLQQSVQKCKLEDLDTYV